MFLHFGKSLKITEHKRWKIGTDIVEKLWRLVKEEVLEEVFSEFLILKIVIFFQDNNWYQLHQM